MAKWIKGALGVAALFWAGSAQAAYVAITFHAWGAGSEMYFDRFGTGLPTGKAGTAYATFGLILDEDNPFVGGMESFHALTDGDRLSAGYQLEAPRNSAQASAFADFAPGTITGGFPRLDNVAPLAGNLSIGYSWASGYYGSFQGEISRVSISYVDAPYPSSGFSITVVPEPSVWAMMIAGFGLVGGAARRQRQGARSGGGAGSGDRTRITSLEG